MKRILSLFPIILLASCSSLNALATDGETTNTSNTTSEAKTTIGNILNFEKGKDFNKFVYKSFTILGTDCYVANTIESGDKDYINALFDYLLDQEVSSTKEQDNTRYGGDMAEYQFDSETYIRFWDSKLFVSNDENSFTGDFYQTSSWKENYPTTTNKESYLSLFTDAKSAKVEETEKTDGVLDGLLNLKFSLYSEEVSQAPVLYTVSVGSEKIYVHEDGAFNFQVSLNTYKLNEGYSFSFLD